MMPLIHGPYMPPDLPGFIRCNHRGCVRTYVNTVPEDWKILNLMAWRSPAKLDVQAVLTLCPDHQVGTIEQ